MLLPAFLSLVVPLVVLISSAEILIKSSEKIARKVGISPLIIGLTIVALGTSLPELVVSAVAVLERHPEIAITNILGSNITNITLILGLSILGGNLRIGTTKTQVNNLMMLLTTIFFSLALVLFGQIPRSLGIFWLIFYLSFLVWDLVAGIGGRRREDKQWFKKAVSPSRKDEKGNLSIYLFPLAILGLVKGGDLFVQKVVDFGHLFGISGSFLGLTLVALGTSLPELVTSLVGVFRKEAKLVEGELLGSNIFNLFFIGGVIASLSTVSFQSWLTIFLLIFSAILGFLSIYLNKGKIVPRRWGFLLCLTYFVYLWLVFRSNQT
jgi:cation:H+ antiporter